MHGEVQSGPLKCLGVKAHIAQVMVEFLLHNLAYKPSQRIVAHERTSHSSNIKALKYFTAHMLLFLVYMTPKLALKMGSN